LEKRKDAQSAAEARRKEVTERKREIVEIKGYCPVCKADTPNRATYVGQLLKQRECKVCGKVIPSLYKLRFEAYCDELLERAGRKALEVREEYRGRWLEFLSVLPLKLGIKAVEEAFYLKELFGPELLRTRQTESPECEKSSSKSQQN